MSRCSKTPTTQVNMKMKKSGKKKLVVGSLFATGCILLFAKIKITKTKKQQPTITQYINRLNEFSLFDFDNAVQEFNSFLSMGVNPDDAFELTVVKRIYI